MKVGIIGCGNISETYFNCQTIFNNFEIIACADINKEFATKSAEQFNVKAQSVDDILSNKEIGLIINLTIPSAHKEIIVKSLNAGKHCFSEKPLAMNMEEGLEIQKLSSEKKLYVGCAPDTLAAVYVVLVCTPQAAYDSTAETMLKVVPQACQFHFGHLFPT